MISSRLLWERHSCRAARAMATYLHAREADAYARLLKERRRRPRAAPSFRFEPRAMPTIEERPPVGLPRRGCATRCTPPAGPRRRWTSRPRRPPGRRRAVAAAAEDLAIRRYLAKQATRRRRAPAPVQADAAARREPPTGTRETLHQLMCAVDEEHAALARQSFRAASRPPGGESRRRPSDPAPLRRLPARDGQEDPCVADARPAFPLSPAAPSRCFSTRGKTVSRLVTAPKVHVALSTSCKLPIFQKHHRVDGREGSFVRVRARPASEREKAH